MRSEIGEQNWPPTKYLADQRLVVTGLDSAGVQTVELVHEALIGGWARLQGWMEIGRVFRTWQEGLRAALRQWGLSDNDDGALLRGAPLAQAENWLAERGTELSLAEREFIQAGVALRESRQAEREAAVNHSLVLPANARQAHENGETDLALALALEMVNMDQSPPQARRTLSTIALGPGTRAILEGHNHTVKGVALGPDGKTALSGSCSTFDSDEACVEDELILWDMSPGWRPGLLCVASKGIQVESTASHLAQRAKLVSPAQAMVR